MNLPTLLALLLWPLLLGADEKTQPGDVVLLKQPGVVAYEEVAESFTEHCRVRVRQVQLDEGPWAKQAARRRVGAAHLVVAVGQPAVDVMAGSAVQIVYALAPDPPPGAVGAESSAPPESLFRALLQARPKVRRIGVVSSHRGAARLHAARLAARALGLELLERSAEDGPQAIQALRDLSSSERPVDALWIGADPQLVTTPVFQYLLQLQLQRGLPVLAATRQQVRSGALLSVDWRPRAVGHRLAALVNLALDGVRHPELSGREDPAGFPEVTINGLMAHKIGIDTTSPRAAGWRIE